MPLLVPPVQVDQRVFRDLVSEKLPRLHAHFEQHKVDYTLITFNWFLVVFVDSVVSDILFKIWDSFLYEGPKVGVPWVTVWAASSVGRGASIPGTCDGDRSTVPLAVGLGSQDSAVICSFIRNTEHQALCPARPVMVCSLSLTFCLMDGGIVPIVWMRQ